MDTKSARQLRNNPTDAERRLWQKLQRRQIAAAKFRRQQPISPFIVDFVCFEHRLIVEVDGGQHAQQVPYDEKRSRWLEAQGYRVLRFWNNDVLANTEAVAQSILEAVDGVSDPPPQSSPARGEEVCVVLTPTENPEEPE